MKNYTLKFSEHLSRKGLKLTPERKKILNGIFSSHKHFDTETLYEALRSKGENISRATIYRTLPLLLESGLVREAVRYKDRVSYEHVFGHGNHGHMICVKCGRVIEFQDDGIEKLRDSISQKHNFKPKEHRFSIRGYCNKCIKRMKINEC